MSLISKIMLKIINSSQKEQTTWSKETKINVTELKNQKKSWRNIWRLGQQIRVKNNNFLRF